MAERNEQNLKKAQERLDKAKTTRSTNLRGYDDALLGVAFAYRSVKEDDKADRAYDQALAVYKEAPGQFSPSGPSRLLWQYLANYSTKEDFESRFLNLQQLVERNTTGDPRELDDAISDCLRNPRGRRGQPSNDKELWKRIVEARASVRGQEDPSLFIPLVRFASACEANKDIDGAEQAYLRAYALNKTDDADVSAQHDLSMATFYLRHNLYDKADAAWHKAERTVQSGVSRSAANSFVRLYDDYRQASREADSDKIVTTLLGDGGDDVVQAFDPKLDECVRGYISSFSFVKAEALIQKRLKASATCKEDTSSNDWRLKLSDIYLATGRNDESTALFRQVLATIALQGLPTDSVRAQRAKLLEGLGRTREAAAMKTSIPTAVVGPIRIQYGLLAQQEVKLGHNAHVDAYDSSDPNSYRMMAFRPSNDGSICCFGTTRREGNLQFGGMVYGKMEPAPPVMLVPLPFAPRQVPAPIALKAFPPALQPPAAAKDMRQDKRAQGVQFPPGDYVTDHIQGPILSNNAAGRTRIFIEDGGFAPVACDSQQIGANNNRPTDLQIWYNGTKKLRINNFRAVIYAPNATVEIPFNGTFAGAIVANRIIAEGNNHLTFDKSLLQEEFKP